ncbi:MAG TPA: GAF domain-containing protein, partial [Alphaproteobacteria bacterium]|nr:GAF domain-containing protein [Alphaproteobacteria bacterium]
MKNRQTNRLYLLLVLYIAASMSYILSQTAANYDQYFHFQQHVRRPFIQGVDRVGLSSVRPEAADAGLGVGDVLETLNDQPYSGEAQLVRSLKDLKPGDVLSLTVRKPDRSIKSVSVRLHELDRAERRVSDWISLTLLFLITPLVCLVLGYWVVAARPHDPNAWIILGLLSFPEVVLYYPNWWTGAWLAFLGVWYESLQIAGPLLLLLLGLYFPERWRLDRKMPWFKWILLVPTLLAWGAILGRDWIFYFDPAWATWIPVASAWTDGILNTTSLLCIVIFVAALIDKLRSASTADSRRRMRVLCVGSLLGLGSLLSIFVLLPILGIQPSKIRWLAYGGVALFLTFPASLAYVVIVQRAMNLRILLRMGTKYALARATLIGVELAAMVFFVSYLIPLAQRNPQQAVNIFLPLVVVLLLVVLLIDANIFSIRRFFFQESLSARLQRWLDRKFFRENYNAEQVLSELSEQARNFTETGPLLDTITRRIADTLHVHNISVLLAGGGAFRLQQTVGLSVSAPLLLMENSSTVRNLKRGGPATLYRDKPDGWFLLADEDERRTLDAMNTELLLPLAGRDRLLGVMALGPKKSEEPYSPSDLRLLQSVSMQTGLALEISEMAHSLADAAAQRERIHREIEIAREVQERLFPQEVP